MFTINNDNIVILDVHVYNLYNNTEYNNNNNNVNCLWQRSSCILLCLYYVMFLSSILASIYLSLNQSEYAALISAYILTMI